MPATAKATSLFKDLEPGSRFLDPDGSGHVMMKMHVPGSVVEMWAYPNAVDLLTGKQKHIPLNTEVEVSESKY